jgi:hypothetical protein
MNLHFRAEVMRAFDAYCVSAMDGFIMRDGNRGPACPSIAECELHLHLHRLSRALIADLRWGNSAKSENSKQQRNVFLRFHEHSSF